MSMNSALRVGASQEVQCNVVETGRLVEDGKVAAVLHQDIFGSRRQSPLLLAIVEGGILIANYYLDRAAETGKTVYDAPAAYAVEDVANRAGIRVQAAVALFKDRRDQVGTQPGLHELVVKQQSNIGLPDLLPEA